MEALATYLLVGTNSGLNCYYDNKITVTSSCDCLWGGLHHLHALLTALL